MLRQRRLLQAHCHVKEFVAFQPPQLTRLDCRQEKHRGLPATVPPEWSPRLEHFSQCWGLFDSESSSTLPLEGLICHVNISVSHTWKKMASFTVGFAVRTRVRSQADTDLLPASQDATKIPSHWHKVFWILRFYAKCLLLSLFVKTIISSNFNTCWSQLK